MREQRRRKVAGEENIAGVTWSPDECTNCTCANGESKCETQKCEYPHKCPRGYREIERLPGQCCRECIEKEATCTVFGDPHYQTFDGFAYTFQGTCRYVLAQECTLRGDKPSFIVVGHNGPWERTDAAWTKHVTIRLQPPGLERAFRISLLPKKRIKEQGKNISSLPYMHRDDPVYTVSLDAQKNVVVRVASIGLKVLWDGHSYVEVTLSNKHQGKVCGLCGNYNRVKDDDTVPQFGSEPADNIVDFAQSWLWGSPDKCEAESDRLYHERSRLSRRHRKMSQLELMRLFGPGSSLRGATAPNMLNKQALLRVFRGSGRDVLPLKVASDTDSETNLFSQWSSQQLSLFRYDIQAGRRLGDSAPVVQNSRATDEGGKKRAKKRRRKQPKKRRSLKKLCGGSAKWRTRRGVIKQCQLLKSDLFRPCRGIVKVGHYFRWCVQDACACPASGRCFCESLMAYGRECERRGVSIDWRPQSHCPNGRQTEMVTIKVGKANRVDIPDDACTVVGAQFSSCACERSCESPAAECNEAACKPGCECPPNLVQLDGRCVPLKQCPLRPSPPN
uniref:BMP binding endothelial regulator n=1 Tax=Plectus sambesii TaxID=2011161 RepID=A0A914UNG7_9BILA